MIADFLPKLFTTAGDEVTTLRGAAVTTNQGRLRDHLNGGANPVIRMYVDSGGGRGNQVGSVRVLDRIIAPATDPIPGLAYTGGGKAAELVYNDAVADTVVVLRQLLGWPADQDQGMYRGLQVSLIPLRDAAGLPQVGLGFSGASDSSANMAAAIRVDCYLRFQPFLWSKPDQVQFSDGRPTVDLAAVPQLGPGFKQRGFSMAVPASVDWAFYINGASPAVRTRLEVLRYLIDTMWDPQNQRYRFALLTTYSIHTTTDSQGNTGKVNAIGMYPYEQVTEVMAGVMATQLGASGPVATALPAVVVNLDDFFYDANAGGTPNDRFGPVQFYLSGGATVLEKNMLQGSTQTALGAKTVWANRATYLGRINAVDRARFSVDPDLNGITATVQNWLLTDQGVPSLQKVLWVQLAPPLPSEVFNYVFSRSTLPAVFEGVNTANFMLNVGKIYYHVSRPQTPDVLYPTQLLAHNPAQRLLLSLQDAANQVGTLLCRWPSNQRFTEYPPELFAGPINAYRSEPSDGPYRSYFHDLGQFYRDPTNDKLSLALAYFAELALPPQTLERGTGAALAADAGDPLDQLYASLIANLHDGDLALVPGALTQGTIYQLLDAIVVAGYGQPFALTSASVTREPASGDPITKVTVTGTLGAEVFGTAASTIIVFTAPQAVLQADVTWGLDDLGGSFPGQAWIIMDKPFVEVVVGDGATLTHGSVGAELRIGSIATIEVQWRFPVQTDAWLITATSNGAPVTLGDLFQLAGGVNLVSSMPPPLNVLADLGFAELALTYRTTPGSVEAISFTLATANPVVLVPNVVSLDGLTVQVTVQSPADVRTRRVSTQSDGTFTIPAGKPGAATITVSATTPQFTFKGNQTSGTIELVDLLTMFLPGIPLDLPNPASLSNFTFAYDQAADSLNVSVDLGTHWQIPPTSPVFDIDTLALAVARVKGVSSGSVDGSMVLLPTSQHPIGVTASAVYDQSTGWKFAAATTTPVLLGDLLQEYLGWSTGGDLGFQSLGLTVVTKDYSWVFTGQTTEWTVPFISGLTFTGSLTTGYEAGSVVALPEIEGTSIGVALASDGATVAGYFARVQMDWTWNGIDLKVWFDYNPTVQKYGITWGVLEGTVTGPDPVTQDWTATLRFTDNVTLGWIVEEMVSWITGSRFALEAPWNLLNSIRLSKLALNYVFNSSDSSRDRVSFTVDIGPIDLGFARIDSVDIVYNSQAEQRVSVTLTGSFPWNIGAGAAGDTGTLGPWDASQPGQAPAPPGNGNKYFDLRLLAMGQHVTADCFATADTVQKAIECMARMPPTDPGSIPPVRFDPSSDWLIGTEFGILRLGDGNGGGGLVLPGLAAPAAVAAAVQEAGYLLTLQAVFNDPHLYGLRIALAGDAAKIFKGLDFQIMYRQVSATVGVYEAQITLPDVMRKLDVGAYSITLPVFGIAVYTNGDFMLDVGFPWNQDFSRSFTFEGIVYPGIPVLGSAGFYFGKLSSATSTQVPNAVNGTFNPVIVFGLGLQVGFGKDVQYGILTAGFSVTVVGILEGVIAKWNPYAITDGGGGDDTQLQGAYYFWLRGTVGVIGKLYGSVDFSIIKADVNIVVKLLVQLTYESYVSISLTVLASVDVTVSIKIDLGIFSVTIHLSFAMQVKETFTIDNIGTPPWRVAGPGAQGALRARPETRLRAHRLRLVGPVLAAGSTPNWSNLAATSPPANLTGYLVTALTAARDEWQTTPTLADQVPAYVTLMLIESVLPANLDGSGSARKAAGDGSDTSFEQLAKMVLRWVVAAVQPSGPLTPAEVDRTVVVTDADLASLLDDVLDSSDTKLVPIPPESIDAFLTGQFELDVQSPKDSVSPDAATYFPVPGELRFAIPGYQYDYGGYNSVSASALRELRTFFDQLAVQVSGASTPAAPAAVQDTSMSMATWVIADYFLLIARQMVQALRDGLRNFQYRLEAGDTLNGVADWINRTGRLTGDHVYTLYDIVAANQSHTLNAAKPLTVGVTHAVVAPDGDTYDTLDSIAGEYSSTLTGVDVAAASALSTDILQPGAVITVSVAPYTYTVRSGDSLLGIATTLEMSFDALLMSTDVLTLRGLLRPSTGTAPSVVLVPLVTYQALSSDTLTSIAALPVYRSGFDAAGLATCNAGRSILAAGARVEYPGRDAYTVQPRDCLGDVAQHFGVPFADLLANSKVLTAPGLLVPTALLAVPPFTYETVTGDTPEQVATRFATTLQVLGDQPANGDVADLFVGVGDGGGPWYLDIPHLPQFLVGELLREAQRSNALQQLSGMVSRFHLCGLRLPTTGITPNTPGMWVRPAQPPYQLPPLAGLYALTGQQFPLPSPVEQGYTITYDRSAGPAWLVFLDGGRQPITTLPVVLEANDVAAISSVAAYAQGNRLGIALDALGADPMTTSDLATYPLTSSLVWQTTAPVTLPYTTSHGEIQALRLWLLPDSLVNLPDPSTRACNPRLSLQVARYDEATGATVRAPVTEYGWGTCIEFTIKRIPPIPGSAAAPTTYEVLGAGGDDILLLERLVAQVGADDSFYQPLILGYVADQVSGANATPGVQTDPLDGVTMGIAQVNLSTETRPPAAAAPPLAAQQSAEWALNTASGFVRLLWEASITAGGGYFLYYYDATDGRGLPDRIFNDRNEASLTLIALYSAPPVSGDQNRLCDFMNVVATGEAIDTGNAVVVAEADPPAGVTTPARADATLAGIAHAWFSDVGDLAQDNSALRLASGAPLTVTAGVYQAPLGGIALAAVASQFGTTVTDLERANPRWGGQLPDPLSYPTAILLPEIALTAGTSPHTSSLADIAGFYGQDLTSLAAANQGVPGIFATVPAQEVRIPGGPRVRSASVPPGVESIGAERPIPAAIPPQPSDPGFADLFLQHAYNLLNYQVADNVYFEASGIGLPSGPTNPSAPSVGGKIRAPRLVAPGDPWLYQQSVPYARFARTSPQPEDGLPDPGSSPYLGVGFLLQVDFTWQDYFGNTLVTVLSDPESGDSPPFNQPPLLTGYTDALVGLGQWPGVSSSWRVTPGSGPDPELGLLLSFSPTRYQGVLEAVPASATSITVTFTDPVDAITAADPRNYSIPDVAVTDASVNGQTVVLTVSGLADDTDDTLSVKGVLSADGRVSLAGQAGFHYPDVPDRRSSTVQSNALQDQRVYTSLYQQLTDPNGIALGIESSLLRGDGGGPGRITLPADQVERLLGWLFRGDPVAHTTSIYQFLDNRASFQSSVAAPPGELEVSTALERARVNDAQVFELRLSFTITRTGGSVLGDLETTPGVREAATTVAPYQQALAPAPNGNGGGTLALTAFATAYQDAMSQAGADVMKVATGVDRTQFSSTQSGATLWSVRLGVTAAEPISYAITPQTRGNPSIFAPRPVSNTLETRRHVGIRDYVTGSGISPTVDRYIDCVDIDMDSWCQQTFAAVDGVLSPALTAATQIVGSLRATDYLQAILDGKRSLAGIAKLLMVPVFDGDTSSPVQAQEAFYQQMLVTLSNAYTTRAALEFQATVNAHVVEPGDAPPRLFGSVALSGGPSFQSATLDPSSLDTLYLRFSEPLLEASATQPDNYTVSGLAVAGVTLSPDGVTVTLTCSGAAQAGTTTVTCSGALVDVDDQPLRPPFTQTVQSFDTAVEPSTLGFTSPKLTLETADLAHPRPLTFLLTAPDVVRGGGGEVVKYLDLDLTYAGTAIEHQIASVPGVEGYTASSWLSFLVTDHPSLLAAELGGFQVPMVLRAYPATPSMANQAGGASSSTDSSDLTRIRQWDYRFTYSLPYHYPQDEVICDVEFNLRDGMPAALAGFTDAFDQLAEFVTVFPAVNQDLTGILATIDATSTDQGDDRQKVDDAAIALQSFITLVDAIVEAAGAAGLAIAPRAPARGGDPQLAYSFTVEEGTVSIGSTPSALLVTLVGVPPPGIGDPYVIVDDADYAWERHPSDPGRLSFVYRRRDGSPGEYLTAADGQAIPERTVVLPAMDVVQRQDAAPVVHLTRNADLVPGRATAGPFVYTTPDVRFADPFHPTIDSSTPIDIAAIGSSAPVTRSLTDQLRTLFAALLADNTQPTLSLQVEVSYAYSLNQFLSPVPLQILLQPPLITDVVPGGSGAGTLEQMIDDWVAAIELWFSTQNPTCGGTLWLDLVIMSTLTQQPMPLLRLRDLFLGLQNVSPPLPCMVSPAGVAP